LDGFLHAGAGSNALYITVADPGEEVWGNIPSNVYGAPFEWRPFAINAPFCHKCALFVPMEVETEIKILYNRQCFLLG